MLSKAFDAGIRALRPAEFRVKIYLPSAPWPPVNGEIEHQARVHKSLFRVVRRVVEQHGLSVLREGYILCKGGPDFGVVRTEDVWRRKAKLTQVKILIEIKTTVSDKALERLLRPQTASAAGTSQAVLKQQSKYALQSGAAVAMVVTPSRRCLYVRPRPTGEGGAPQGQDHHRDQDRRARRGDGGAPRRHERRSDGAYPPRAT